MKTMQLSLRAGQKIYLNGAVIRADRKVTLELLNDATFLLDNHVMQADETTTPLRQLYFVVQTMLIDPAARDQSAQLFAHMHAALLRSFADERIRAGLIEVADHVRAGKPFDALRGLRQLFPAEETILHGQAVAA